MRFLAFLIIASVILSLARALTLVLILVFVVSLLWAVITRPLELLGFLLIALLMEALSLSPVTTILGIAGIAALAIILKPAEKGS
jgi:hypothetical protein